MQISIDGYVAGPNGEMDWMVWNWDEGLLNYVKELTAPVDCIVLGRVLAKGFIPHWTAAANEESADSFTKIMSDTPKIVFTKTLEKSEWSNASLAKGSLEEEIQALKSQEGGDIIVYGGANFVSNLIEANLIDELHLFVNPTALGNGMKIFNGLTKLDLVKNIAFDCGINVLFYKPKI